MEKIFQISEIYEEKGLMKNAFFCIEGSKIKKICPADSSKIPDYILEDCIIIPGIIDIHSHGCMGYSATSNDMNEIYGYTKAIASTGVTGVFATTQEFDSMSCVADVINSKNVKGAKILGIQAEGPFRHPKYMGASKGFDWPRPSVDYAKKMIEAGKGHLKYVSVSTDLEEIDEVMIYFLQENIKIAAGHTDADYEEMKKGFQMGATSISHFGNAMRPIHQRNGGAVVACLLDPNVYLEVICDHVHLSPEIIDLYFKVKDLEHFILISDSSELAGMPKGRYNARGKERIVNEEGNILIDDGTISGSGKNILNNMKNLIFKHNLSIEDVIKMGTIQPARYFSLDDNKGSIKVGKDADFVILDKNWNVLKTYVEGVLQYDSAVDHTLINRKMKKII